MQVNNVQRWAVWRERWQALDGILYDLEEEYEKYTNTRTSFERVKTLKSLTQNLREFASGQFHFFYDGFGVESSFKLAESKEYPPEFVFSTLLDQVSHDLEVIQRAGDQRKCGTPEMKETLRKADKLTMDAIQQAIKRELLDAQTTVLTYFQKAASIRVIPYAPVALIGIPYTCISVPRDYLAIAHEVGHYVYRHRQGNRQYMPVDRSFTNIMLDEALAQYADWQEEMYADIYGALIAGPMIALSFQDLSLEHSGEGFIKDDGDHPTPTLRPYLYNKVLHSRNTSINKWSSFASKLDTRWNAILDERNSDRKLLREKKKRLLLQTDTAEPVAQQQTVRTQQGQGQAATIIGLVVDNDGQQGNSDPQSRVIVIDSHEIRNVMAKGTTLTENEPLDKIISSLLEQLPDIQSDWPSAVPTTSDIDQLEQEFNSRMDVRLDELAAPQDYDASEAPAQRVELWNDWVKREMFFGGELSPAGDIPPGSAKDLWKVPNGTWVQVWYAGGWSTQGPETEPHG